MQKVNNEEIDRCLYTRYKIRIFLQEGAYPVKNIDPLLSYSAPRYCFLRITSSDKPIRPVSETWLLSYCMIVPGIGQPGGKPFSV
jgi:hypothetical protein